MTPDDDELIQALAGLPLVQPDMEWEARVRARCHSAISRRALRRVRVERSLSRRGLIGLAASALCIYLAAMLAEAARLAGFIL